MKHLIPKLTSRLKGMGNPSSLSAIPRWKNDLPDEAAKDITQMWLWPRVGEFFKPKDIVVTETGMQSYHMRVMDLHLQ
jgi:pyruvate decarboxylase